jgi:hypothetical protein
MWIAHSRHAYESVDEPQQPEYFAYVSDYCFVKRCQFAASCRDFQIHELFSNRCTPCGLEKSGVQKEQDSANKIRGVAK